MQFNFSLRMTVLNRFYEEMLPCGHYITVIKINVNLKYKNIYWVSVIYGGGGCVVCGRCKVFSDCTYSSKGDQSMQSSTQQQLLIREDCPSNSRETGIGMIVAVYPDNYTIQYNIRLIKY